MMYIKCEHCGSNLDHGEYCDCTEENEINAAAEILDIYNIINIGDTGASQNAAINSMLKIKNRLEGKRR